MCSTAMLVIAGLYVECWTGSMWLQVQKETCIKNSNVEYKLEPSNARPVYIEEKDKTVWFCLIR